MSFGFVEVINSIEAEISSQYLPGAIRWADEKFDGAWSKAIDRFERSLVFTRERADYNSIRIEIEAYRRTVLELLRKYKTEKNLENVESFLGGIASSTLAS